MLPEGYSGSIRAAEAIGEEAGLINRVVIQGNIKVILD